MNLIEPMHNVEIEVGDNVYDQRHGGPFNRGACDAYFSRGYDPHFYLGETYTSKRVDIDHMTEADIDAYTAGYEAVLEKLDGEPLHQRMGY